MAICHAFRPRQPPSSPEIVRSSDAVCTRIVDSVQIREEESSVEEDPQRNPEGNDICGTREADSDRNDEYDALSGPVGVARRMLEDIRRGIIPTVQWTSLIAP
jgi:hypothetical protein